MKIVESFAILRLNLFVASAFLVSCVPPPSAARSADTASIQFATKTCCENEHKPVVRVEATTELEERRIGDGGFDTVLKGGGTFFFPDSLAACGNTVRDWVSKWASTHHLQVLYVQNDEDGTRHVTHIAAPDSGGFFRFQYSWRNNGNSVVGAVTFHERTGSATELDTTRYPLLDLASLPQGLLDCMRCKK